MYGPGAAIFFASYSLFQVRRTGGYAAALAVMAAALLFAALIVLVLGRRAQPGRVIVASRLEDRA